MESRDIAKATNGDSQFVRQVRQPNKVETKKMISFLAAKGVEVVMIIHYYTIGGIIMRQEESGDIGSDMTGEVTRNYMILWNTKLMSLYIL